MPLEKGSVEMTNPLAQRPYLSGITDAQWEILAPFIPEPGVESPASLSRDERLSMAFSTCCERAAMETDTI